MPGTGPWCRRMPGQRHSALPVGLEPTTRCLEASQTRTACSAGPSEVSDERNPLSYPPMQRGLQPGLLSPSRDEREVAGADDGVVVGDGQRLNVGEGCEPVHAGRA